MNYSQVGIANVALQRIGARGTIQSVTENSPNAVKVNVCWDTIFGEVLSERDWKFAKTRVQLQQSALVPTYGYKYAYALPADFLRLCKPREIPQERRIADASRWEYGGDWNGGGCHHRDVPVWPREAAPYVTETLQNPTGNSGQQTPSYQTCLLTNYAAQVIPLAITYIRLITDLTQLTPGFVNALCYRLAAELAVSVTEDMKKSQSAMEMYRQALLSSQAQVECDDFLKDEQGSQSWIQAGRYWRDW